MTDAQKNRLKELVEAYADKARCTTEVYTQYIQDRDDDQIESEDQADYDESQAKEKVAEQELLSYIDSL